MKGRFPPDLFAVVFGPVLVLIIMIGLGSLLFHVEQLRSSAAGQALMIAAIAVLLAILSFRIRRRR